MKTRIRSMALAGLALSWVALASLSGCLYVSDAIGRDADGLTTIPRSTVEGARADLKNYKVVKQEGGKDDEREERK